MNVVLEPWAVLVLAVLVGSQTAIICYFVWSALSAISQLLLAWKKNRKLSADLAQSHLTTKARSV